jgi:hypothetical protein
MAGKSKGMYCPKIFLTRPSPADYHPHFRSFLWFLEDDIHHSAIDASFFLIANIRAVTVFALMTSAGVIDIDIAGYLKAGG